MQVEILLAALVLVVAALVAVDLLRRTSDAPHEHADRPGHEAEREISPASHAGTGVFPYPAARRGRAAQGAGAGHAGSRQGAPGVQKNWRVWTRLCLLAAISAVAPPLAAGGAPRRGGCLPGGPVPFRVSSPRYQAVRAGPPG